ncbi:MAG: hypothetical protein Q8P40_08560 [Nitrospirota bacterium]|nr:hypothetical protein [Nitrospirota bacterium]
MDILNIIPIELRGMSIFTLIFFGFTGIAFKFVWDIMKKELKDINTRLDQHSKKLEDRNKDISEMRTDIALTLQAIKNIEKMIKRMDCR